MRVISQWFESLSKVLELLTVVDKHNTIVGQFSKQVWDVQPRDVESSDPDQHLYKSYTIFRQVYIEGGRLHGDLQAVYQPPELGCRALHDSRGDNACKEGNGRCCLANMVALIALNDG